MNNVIFMYKPAYFGEHIADSLLEFYSSERTEDLRRSGLLKVYEEYWKAHEVFKTSIYGAIPESVLTAEQKIRLQRFGWREANVSPVSIASGELENEILLQDKKKYIVIKEKENVFTLLQFYFRPQLWYSSAGI